MKLSDSRRITGPTLICEGPGAALELLVGVDEHEARDALIGVYRDCVARMLAALGLEPPRFFSRVYGAGVSLGFFAAFDALYTACAINEWAIAAAAASLGLQVEEAPTEPEEEALGRLGAELAAERNPALHALIDGARRHGVPFLTDDDYFSLGFGSHAQTWPVQDLPAADEIDWAARCRIPVVVLTGTNGKTTTSRLLARILNAAGLVAGATSTDAITIDGQVVDKGDWTGPGAARTVLRNERVEAAVLETARGGILRRGLAYAGYDVGLVTNVADDHLGEWGVENTQDMAQAKLTVARAVRSDGHVVLNAEDPLLVQYASQAAAPITWFAVDPDNEVLVEHLKGGGRGLTVEDGQLVLCEGQSRQSVVAVDSLPITFGGAARFNVSNALGAAGCAWGIGVDPKAMAEGLRALHPSPVDNPGRANIWQIGQVTLFADFAHNNHGIAALFDFLNRARPTGRRIVLIGQAGDRDDESLREMAEMVFRGGIDEVICRPLAKYLRGRDLMELPELFAQTFRNLGVAADRVHLAADDRAALDDALGLAKPGDLILALLAVDKDALNSFVDRHGGLLKETVAP